MIIIIKAVISLPFLSAHYQTYTYNTFVGVMAFNAKNAKQTS